jgi:hypothetical protein
MRRTYIALGAFLFASVGMFGVIAGASAAPGEADYLNPQNESYYINDSDMRESEPVGYDRAPEWAREPVLGGGGDLWGIGAGVHAGMQASANTLLVGAIHVANVGIALGQQLHWLPDGVFSAIADAWTVVGLAGLGGALYLDVKEVLA